MADSDYDAGFDRGKEVGRDGVLREMSGRGPCRVKRLPDGFYQATEVAEAYDRFDMVAFAVGSLFGSASGVVLAIALIG
jgi:hypothetical protein